MQLFSIAKLTLGAIALGVAGLVSAAGALAPKPSVVIIHGAFADGSDWAKVIPLLRAKGVSVTSVQNPLTSLKDDVAAAKRAIDTQPGKVVLVGHSWGGTVITEAGTDEKVSALVYVAAFAPDAGQNTAELGRGYPPPPGLAFLKADAAGYLALTPEGMTKHFAPDVPAAESSLMHATQGPIFGKAFDEQVSVAAWKSKPSWFIVAESDHMIQPAQQHDMAKKIGARVTSLKTSHVPQRVYPAKVAEVILQAVEKSR